MNRLMLLGSLIMLGVAFGARAQEGGLPPCKAAQLAVVDGYMFDHYELTELGLTKEAVATFSPKTYEELGDLVKHETSAESLKAYGDVLFAWREMFWQSHPICAEVFDIGLRMAESAADLAGFSAYHLAGVAADDNPYIESYRMGVGLLSLLLEDVPNQPAAELDPEANSDLRACGDYDLDVLSGIFAEYRALLEVPPRTYSPVGLAKYGVAQLSWRDTLWSRLPLCDLSLQLGLLMSHITGDLALALALEIAGMPDEATSFAERIAADQARLGQLAEPVKARGQLKVESRGFAAVLPACADADMLDFYTRNVIFVELVAQLKTAKTLPALLEAAEKHTQWRRALEADLPACREALLTGLLAYRVTANHVSALALDIAGVYPEPSAEQPINPDLSGIVTINFMAQTMAEAIAQSGKTAEELLEGAASSARSLPACVDGDLDINFYNLFIEYDEVSASAAEVEDARDVLEYRQAQVDWGERNIPRLPGCREGIDAGLLMFTNLADYSGAYGLLLAGAAVEDIPYADTLRSYQRRLDAWLKEELQ